MASFSTKVQLAKEHINAANFNMLGVETGFEASIGAK
jgi:hypothetical protein